MRYVVVEGRMQREVSVREMAIARLCSSVHPAVIEPCSVWMAGLDGAFRY